MHLRAAFLGAAAALLGAAVAHDAWAGKSGGGRSAASSGGTRAMSSGGTRFAAPAMRSSFATVNGRVVASPQHIHNGSFPHRHFHSGFVAIGVGVPIYSYPGAYYYPGYYSPPPPPPGWYFCPAYNAYYPASVPCPGYGPPQGYAPAPQMYGAPPDMYGVPPDYVPQQ
jgi:hypothetical protein